MEYSRPAIIAIDLEPTLAATLAADGFNVVEGTFGVPKTIPRDRTVHPVDTSDARLPGFAEKDIFIVDLGGREPVAYSRGDTPVTGEREIFASAKDGIIDPRPRVMHGVRQKVQRVLDHGGILVVVTDLRTDPNYIWGIPGYTGIETQTELPWSNWDLVQELEAIEVAYDHGTEMQPTESASNLGLAQFLEAGQFDVAVTPSYSQTERWLSLAKNKFGHDVAGLLKVPGDAAGFIVLLPRVSDLSGALKALLRRVLPMLAPTLFPEHGGESWRARPEYSLRRVSELQQEISAIQREAASRIEAIELSIDQERTKHPWLTALLTASGDELVQAVAEALRAIGCTDVRDGDADAKALERPGLREDLQVWDRSPLLLIEVKGVGGQPSESESLQVLTYLAGRMRELGRTDIKGLTIVNHQRGTAPLNRDHTHTFTSDVLATASTQHVGLLTTFDLYRLARGVLECNWPRNWVTELLYRDGRISPLPEHYVPVGEVTNFFEVPSAVAIALDDTASIAVGDRLAFDLRTHYFEEVANSLQQEGQDIASVTGPTEVGIHSSLLKAEARPGRRVFKISTAES